MKFSRLPNNVHFLFNYQGFYAPCTGCPKKSGAINIIIYSIQKDKEFVESA